MIWKGSVVERRKKRDKVKIKGRIRRGEKRGGEERRRRREE